MASKKEKYFWLIVTGIIALSVILTSYNTLVRKDFIIYEEEIR